MIDLLKATDETPICALDVETTGLSSLTDRVIEVAAVKRTGDGEIEKKSFLLDPGVPISERITEITGITGEMIKTGAAPQKDSLAEILAFCEGAVLCAHNAPFDVGFLAVEMQRAGLKLPESPIFDTLKMARKKITGIDNYKLGTIYQYLFPRDDFSSAHRAAADAAACLKICRHLLGSGTEAVGKVARWATSDVGFDNYQIDAAGFGLFGARVADAIRDARTVTVRLRAYAIGIEGIPLAIAREKGKVVLLMDTVVWGNRPLMVESITTIDF